MDERKPVPIRKVRAWARDRGIPVGNRGHLSQELIDQFNRAHRKVSATNSNPMLTVYATDDVTDDELQALLEEEAAIARRTRAE
jgi:hypothetical protein